MQEYDFENSLGFIVNRTARAFVKALDLELHENVGITVGQWKVIVMLVNHNGLTQKEIADKLGLEGPTLIPIIDKMEKEELVIRRVDPSDRRNNQIYRTEKADALWERMMHCALKVRKVSVKGISEEDLGIMRAVLDKIWYNLRAEFNVSSATAAENNNVLAYTKDKTSDNIPNTITTIAANNLSKPGTTISKTLTSTSKRKSKRT
ncbi:MAG TPA: MarR family transcriptional regulator [Nitrososphaeraceae archaeon]|jgi:MarR family transcriptional regulator for hemolysin|nr:MarR family transcriptional regulator [Nitrososphaeraceae archaeon]